MNKNKIIEYIKNPALLFMFLGHRGFLNWLSDDVYLKILFYIKMRRKLNLLHPVTFNEKLQWLKINDRRAEYSLMVDKYEAKNFVANIIGEQYIIPTLGVWNRFSDINFDSLPSQFVLKCTHDSGGLVICKDKKHFNVDSARKVINRCLKHNFYWAGREWPYKNVQPRIIAEQYMADDKTGELPDYKFFAFNGEVKALFIATERGGAGETKFDFFDVDFNHLPFLNGHPNAEVVPEKPRQFDLMKELAGKLSVGLPQIRIDLYEVNGKVYFGEFTFSHWSGFKPFVPREWDYKFGSWINLPQC